MVGNSSSAALGKWKEEWVEKRTKCWKNFTSALELERCPKKGAGRRDSQRSQGKGKPIPEKVCQEMGSNSRGERRPLGVRAVNGGRWVVNPS